MPEEYRARFEGFDESRTADLDMDRYRVALEQGRRALASMRVIDYLRPRDKERDSEYLE